MPLTVLLVATRPSPELARYLRDAGFAVRTSELLRAKGEDAVVWLTEADVDDHLVCAEVRDWLAAKPTAVTIIISHRSTRLRALVGSTGARLAVLPAPVFGWQLVDVLRGEPGDRP